MDKQRLLDTGANEFAKMLENGLNVLATMYGWEQQRTLTQFGELVQDLIRSTRKRLEEKPPLEEEGI